MKSFESLNNALDNICFIEELIKQNVSKENIITALAKTDSISSDITASNLTDVLNSSKLSLLENIKQSNEGWFDNIMYELTKDKNVKMRIAKAAFIMDHMTNPEIDKFLSKRLGVTGYKAADTKLIQDDLTKIIQVLNKYVTLITEYGKIFHTGGSNLDGTLKEEFIEKVKPFMNECKALYENINVSIKKSHEAYYHRQIKAGTMTLKDMGYTAENLNRGMTDYVNKISGMFDVIKQLAAFSNTYGWTANREAANENIVPSNEYIVVMQTYYGRKSFAYIRFVAEYSWLYYRAIDKQYYSIARSLA